MQYVLETRTDPRAGSVRRALLLPVRKHEFKRAHALLTVLRTEPDQSMTPPAAPRRSLTRLLAKPFYPLFGIASPCYSI